MTFIRGMLTRRSRGEASIWVIIEERRRIGRGIIDNGGRSLLDTVFVVSCRANVSGDTSKDTFRRVVLCLRDADPFGV